MSKDQIGDRMKKNYEGRTKQFLPRRTYTIIRLDGKAFHTFTKQFKRPYDINFMSMMNETAKALCENIQGAKLAYVQSDEITLVLTDFETLTTDAWFDGNVQKMTSISASIATAEFNKQYLKHCLFMADVFDGNFKSEEVEKLLSAKPAHFDSRVFTIPELEEVLNCLIWRQQDATRNAIQMLGQAHFSHKELHQKSTSNIQDMLMLQKGVNFNDQPVGFKRGRLIKKESYHQPVINQKVNYTEFRTSLRTRWIVDEPPIFSQDRAYLYDIIPGQGMKVATDYIVTLPDGIKVEQVEGANDSHNS